MTYEKEIEFHPLYELVSSMVVFTNPKLYYDLDKRWFQILESKVASIFMENIRNEERLQEIGFLLLMIWKCPNKTTLFDFLK